jgi:hypothetical protein
MGFFGTNKKQLGQQNTKHLKPGFGGVKAAWYKLTNVPYLDIVIVRGRKRIMRIVDKDEGFDMFTVDGLGTFMLPQGDDMQKMIYYGPGVYLFYRHDSQTPGELVDQKEWATFKFPPYPPSVFQKKLEAKSIADILSEEQKDMGWILWIAGLAVVLVIGFLVFGGGV